MLKRRKGNIVKMSYWLSIKPYKNSSEVDYFFINLANDIHDDLEEDDLIQFLLMHQKN